MSNYNDINNPNNNPNINQNPDNNFISNMTNENFINMASSINLDNLNGTNIMDLGRDTLSTINNLPSLNTISSYNNMTSLNNKSPMNNIQYFNNLSSANLANNMQNNMQNNNNNSQIQGQGQGQDYGQAQAQAQGQEKHLIKSITRELINNLKENNILVHDDNTTYNSKFTNKSNKIRIGKKSNDSSNEDYENYENYENYEKINENISNQSGNMPIKKKSKKIYEYKDDLKKGLEHMMSENGVPAPSNVTSYIFDELFNLKEFIILFGVYFLLSQEMVKDIFAQYFTSLNPDDSGKIHVKGVIIYGLILTILFMVLKKMI
jgi:hypothetical protein